MAKQQTFWCSLENTENMLINQIRPSISTKVLFIGHNTTEGVGSSVTRLLTQHITTFEPINSGFTLNILV